MKRILNSGLARLRRPTVDLTDTPVDGIIGYTLDARGWDPDSDDLTTPVDEDTARALHRGGRTVSQVVRSRGRLVVVSVRPTGQIDVARYDATGTYPAQVRDFRVIDDRVWLRSIKQVSGDERTAAPGAVITDWFTWVQPDTTATWTRFDRRSPQGRAHELRLDWDPADNWFALPAFGDYVGLVEPADLLPRLWPSATRSQLTP
ncbi:MAG: hypothetical protein ACXIVQ_14210 [Acidimicrobiales bacterium]